MTSIPHSANRHSAETQSTNKPKHSVGTQNSSDDTRPLLQMRDVDIAFGGKKRPVPTVFGVNLDIYPGGDCRDRR